MKCTLKFLVFKPGITLPGACTTDTLSLHGKLHGVSVLKNLVVVPVRSLLFFSALLLSLYQAQSCMAQDHKAITVLFLSSWTRDLPVQVALETSLRETLLIDHPENTLYFEYLEGPLLPVENVTKALRPYLESKYPDPMLDYVVAWDDRAIGFLTSQPELFPHTRRIYLEGEKLPLENANGLTDRERYIHITSDLQATLQEMWRLYSVEHIYVIGSLEDKGAADRLENFKKAAATVFPAIRFTYLYDLSIQEVIDRLNSNRGEKAAAFFLLMFSDGKGNPMTPYRVMEKIAPYSSVPIFAYYESLLGSGIVGGNLFSHTQLGRNLGRIIEESAEAGAVTKISAMRTAYDWKALKRWQIDPQSIATDSYRINVPENILYKYRYYIWFAVSVIFSLIIIIALLSTLLAVKKKASERLEKTNKELKSANAELDQFAYVVSHDLKSPLRAIHNYADFLKEDLGDNLNADIQLYLERMGDAVQRSENQVEDLLQFSRIGRSKIKDQEIELSRLLREIVEDIKPDADSRVDIPDTGPTIVANYVYLTQIFQNLIANGLKFNTSSPKHVTVSFEKEEGLVRCQVSDNGIGIEPRFHQKIFGVFSRLHTLEEFDGTGIGLAIVKKAVETLGGTIEVASIPQEGSSFIVRIPRHAADINREV